MISRMSSAAKKHGKRTVKRFYRLRNGNKLDPYFNTHVIRYDRDVVPRWVTVFSASSMSDFFFDKQDLVDMNPMFFYIESDEVVQFFVEKDGVKTLEYEVHLYKIESVVNAFALLDLQDRLLWLQDSIRKVHQLHSDCISFRSARANYS
jgi:hypothetical protein